LQFPQSLLQQLVQHWGIDPDAFMHAQEQQAINSIRFNPYKIQERILNDKIESAIPWSMNGYKLNDRPIFTLDPHFHAGAYYVQEASSMFVGYIFKHLFPATDQALRVLDLCASPGGKSTDIASLINEKSLLISNEVNRDRASVLTDNIQKWGSANTWVTCNDPKQFTSIHAYFDCILVDAPCSGSGLFRKDKRAIDEWSEANVKLCSERQKRILNDVWNSLADGGYLIYATCSFSKEENEDIVDYLINQFHAISLKTSLQMGWGVLETKGKEADSYGYRFMPHLVEGEGFFISVLQKQTVSEKVDFNFSSEKKVDRNSKKKVPPVQLGFLEGIFSNDQYRISNLEKYGVVAVNKEHLADFELLKSKLYFRKIGVSIGEQMGSQIVPNHDLALYNQFPKELISTINLDETNALKFLKKEPFEFEGNIEKGWVLVVYKGLGIGWVKNIGNRMNNYLPKHFRIRMDLDR
jgi:NOL1/NOP2/sun family putative RNA methylase